MLLRSIPALIFSCLLLTACGGGGDGQTSPPTTPNPNQDQVTVLGTRALPGLGVQVESVPGRADSVCVRCSTSEVIEKIEVLRGADYSSGTMMPTERRSDGTWLVTFPGGNLSPGDLLLVRALFTNGNLVETAPGDITW